MRELNIVEASWSMDASGSWLKLKPDFPGQAQMVAGEMDPQKKYTVTIKEFRKKRSLDANAYFHLLVGKIADTANLGFEETKTNLVTEYGTVDRDKNGGAVGFMLPASADVSEYYRYVKWFDSRVVNGTEFNCYIVFKQTHKMDSKEMSRLIEGTVQEAQNLGIETLTPEELERMALEWRQDEKGNEGDKDL